MKEIYYQPIVLILSILLFVNPDIDRICMVAAVLLLISMGDMGIMLIKRAKEKQSA